MLESKKERKTRLKKKQKENKNKAGINEEQSELRLEMKYLLH